MTRDERLATLSNTPRVWSHLERENVVGGLIDLCVEWIKPHFVMAEIGCFAGVSTSVFAEFAAKVYAVDPWTLVSKTGYVEVYQDMLEKAETEFLAKMATRPNIVRMQEFSLVAACGFDDNSLDAVYIDGDHSKLLEDIVAWLPKIKADGLLMGHDVDLLGFLQIKIEPVKVYPESSWVIPKSEVPTDSVG